MKKGFSINRRILATIFVVVAIFSIVIVSLYSRLHVVSFAHDEYVNSIVYSSITVQKSSLRTWAVTSTEGLVAESHDGSSLFMPYGSIFYGISKGSEQLESLFPFQAIIDLSKQSHSVAETDLPDIAHLPTPSIVSELCDASMLEDGVDYPGGDITSSETQSAAGCCELCINTIACTHWTFVLDTASCWIKGGDIMVNKRRKSTNGLVSGVMTPEQRTTKLSIQLQSVAGKNGQQNSEKSCCQQPSSSKENVSLFTNVIERQTVNSLSTFQSSGDWQQQFPLGNGHFGAFVGGTSMNEIVPLSAAGWFGYNANTLLEQAERRKRKSSGINQNATPFEEGRRLLLAGKIDASISSLSNLQSGGLGMFQYLGDLAISTAPQPFQKVKDESPASHQTPPVVGRMRGQVPQLRTNSLSSTPGSGRAKLINWLNKYVHSESTGIAKSLSVLAEGRLDLQTGVMFSHHVESHHPKEVKSSPGAREVRSEFTTHLYKEWYLSAVDDVLVGNFRCQSSLSLKGDHPQNSTTTRSTDCLNIALGLVRDHDGNSEVPTVKYGALNVKSKDALSRITDVDMSIKSSAQTIVPTTHVCGRLICTQREEPSRQSARDYKDESADGIHDFGSSAGEEPGVIVCNAASEIWMLWSVATVDTLGQDPLHYDSSETAQSAVKEQCWATIKRALKKGSSKLRADHVEHVSAIMKTTTLSLSSYDATASSENMNIQDCKASQVDRTFQSLQSFGSSCLQRTSVTNEPDNRPPSHMEIAEDDLLLASQLYTFGRYLFMSSANARSVPNLQGLWADGVRSEWNGDYHLNINVQMMYWPVATSFPTSDYLAPLQEFVMKLAANGRAIAEELYQAGDKTNQSSAPWVAHGFVDSSLRGGILGDLQWSLCVTCGAWLATQLFDRFATSSKVVHDLAAMEDVLEVYRGLVDFFQDHYLFSTTSSPEGILHTGPTTSPENSYFFHSGANAPSKPVYLTFSPAIDLSVLRELANVYYTLATWYEKGIREQQQTTKSQNFLVHAIRYKRTVLRLPHQALPSLVSIDGDQVSPEKTHVIREYPVCTLPLLQDSLSDSGYDVGSTPCSVSETLDPGHRHFSLLHWLYPANFLPHTASCLLSGSSLSPLESASPTAAADTLFAAAKASLQRKRSHHGGHTAWSAAWEASLWARLGDGEQSWVSLRHLVKFYLTPNLLTLHPPLQHCGPEDCHTCFEDSIHRDPMDTVVTSEDTTNRLHRRLSKESAPIVQQAPSIVASGPRKLEPQQLAAHLARIHAQQLAHQHTSPSAVQSLSRPRGFHTSNSDKFQLDGNLGYLAAMNELLLQSHLPRRLILLPALPPVWKSHGQIKGLRARGDVTVSIRWQGGDVQQALFSFTMPWHPWWNSDGGIDEDCLHRGHYGSTIEEAKASSKSSLSSEISLLSPNEVSILDPAELDGPGHRLGQLLISKLQINEQTLCRNFSNERKLCTRCETMPSSRLFKVVTMTLSGGSNVSTGKSCIVLACDSRVETSECINGALKML